MNLKEMTIEALENLRKEIMDELKSRTPELVLYAHDCKKSAKYHLDKYKHWAKLVTSIDTTKTNGYAFVGDFLSVYNEHKLPIGSIVAEVCDTSITVYRITLEGKQEIASGFTKSMSAVIEAASATY